MPRFQPFLLLGVDVSGKTEMGLRAVEQALMRNKGCLVLVPEGALTPASEASNAVLNLGRGGSSG